MIGQRVQIIAGEWAGLRGVVRRVKGRSVVVHDDQRSGVYTVARRSVIPDRRHGVSRAEVAKLARAVMVRRFHTYTPQGPAYITRPTRCFDLAKPGRILSAAECAIAWSLVGNDTLAFSWERGPP